MGRITRIEIEAFRGISEYRLLDFTKSGKPTNILIVGDNGSGKSSIVDAIEFVTQGKIHNSSSLSNPNKQEIQNLFTKKKPILSVTLENEVTYTKKMVYDSKGHRKIQGGNVGAFSLGPFVLRRDNILQFWNTSHLQRQVIFFNYNIEGANKRIEDGIIDKINDLSAERTELKKQRNAALKVLAEYKKIKIESIPRELSKFTPWVENNLTLGVSIEKIRQAKKKGLKFHLSDEIENAIDDYYRCSKRILQINSEKKKLSPGGGAKISKKKVLNQLFLDISNSITETFLSISSMQSEITNIEVQAGKDTEVSMGFKIILSNRTQTTPEQVLSEANLDLLAFCIYLEMVKKCVSLGQSPVLVLDDVFQSVDAGIRLKILDYILREQSDWQIILTVHDRLWKEQIIQCFHQNNVKLNILELTDWKGSRGIKYIDESILIEDVVHRAQEKGSISGILSISSIMFEKICNNLSFRLPISVTRRKGDRYTLGDLWPGIVKVLKRTVLIDVIEELNRTSYLRNMAGGHYNEWAQKLSRKDANEFANAVISLWRSVCCDECYTWIEEVRIGTSKTVGWSCRCQKIYYEK